MGPGTMCFKEQFHQILRCWLPWNYCKCQLLSSGSAFTFQADFILHALSSMSLSLAVAVSWNQNSTSYKAQFPVWCCGEMQKEEIRKSDFGHVDCALKRDSRIPTAPLPICQDLYKILSKVPQCLPTMDGNVQICCSKCVLHLNELINSDIYLQQQKAN